MRRDPGNREHSLSLAARAALLRRAHFDEWILIGHDGPVQELPDGQLLEHLGEDEDRPELAACGQALVVHPKLGRQGSWSIVKCAQGRDLQDDVSTTKGEEARCT